jgi:hypothetical protein
MANICFSLTLTFCFITSFSVGQTLKGDTTQRESHITYSQDENRVNFSAITPPLEQIQGAPLAFYTFYWELGDGNYSFDPNPKHTYKKTGEHKVQLWTTNNYDNGKPPPSRPQKIPVKKITYQDNAEQLPKLDEHNGFRLQINRSPVPDEEMVVIASYKNSSEYPSNGKLYVFYNEIKYKADNFSLVEVRTHHGEREVLDQPAVAMLSSGQHPDNLWASLTPVWIGNANTIESEDATLSATLMQSKERYKDWRILEFNDMASGEERNVFYTFKTTHDMLKDTNAIITIRGVYVPEKGKDNHKVKELEMEIVTSHDPNKMSVSDARLNYRFMKNKELKFKVRFQNNGEGPARSIKLNVDVPKVFVKSSLQVLEMYPQCPICPDEEAVTYSCLDTAFLQDKIIFHFKNIYLPGSKQNNVEDKDSTRGFVKYLLKFDDKVPKQNTVSRTAIIFDKNEPILTNYSTTRFKPGISLGVKAGYSYMPDTIESRSYFAGITLSPYKSHRQYLQAEILLARHTSFDSSKYSVVTQSPLGNGLLDLDEVAARSEYQNIILYLIPVSYRYTINKFVGIGGGVQLSTNMTEQVQTNTAHTYYLTRGLGTFLERNPELDYKTSTTLHKRFNGLNTDLFADVILGSARIGPAIGIRYVYSFNSRPEQWQFYALWKI